MSGESRLSIPVPFHLNSHGDAVRAVGTRLEPAFNLADTAALLGYADVPAAVKEWLRTYGKGRLIFVGGANGKSSRGRPRTYDCWYAPEARANASKSITP